MDIEQEEKRLARQNILKQIEDILDRLPDYATCQLIVKKHRGKLTKLEAMKSTPHSFSQEDANVQAAMQVYALMDSVVKSKDTGALSFTIVANKGRFSNMQVQDFRKL